MLLGKKKAGSEVKNIEVSNLVAALVKTGAYAEYVAVDARHCIVLPDMGKDTEVRFYRIFFFEFFLFFLFVCLLFSDKVLL